MSERKILSKILRLDKNIYNEEFDYSWADINNSLISALKVEPNVI